MDDFESVIEQLKQELGEDKITTTNDPKIKRPEKALDREMFEDFNKRNPLAGGGMLVQPGFGGTRQGYADKSGRETVHLVNVTGNPNHSGIYRTTNLKTGSVSYRGGFTRRGKGGRQTTPTRSTIKQARADLDKALKIPKDICRAPAKILLIYKKKEVQVIY